VVLEVVVVRGWVFWGKETRGRCNALVSGFRRLMLVVEGVSQPPTKKKKVLDGGGRTV